MKKRNKRGNLFTLLLRNYIAFTILVIVIFIGAIFLAFFDNQLNLIDFDQVLEYEDLLSSEEYDQFPVNRLLGKDGSIAVLDEDGEVVFNTTNQDIHLTANEIAYIPDALSDFYIDTKEITTSQDKINYEITISFADGGKEVFILDENYNTLYRSTDKVKNQLTQKEYQLLANEYFKNYTVNKYPFFTQDGKSHTLLLFHYIENDLEELRQLGMSFSQSLLYFTILYILLIILLIFWLKKKINQPLKLLCDTFNDYHVGQSISQSYYGPKEFVDIFENFSSMAHRLEESEKQKKLLEDNRRKMIADIVHDFKTPIAVIQGYAKAIEDGIVPLQQQRQYLSIISNKSKQLNELILTLYEYSKIEHPDFRLNMERVDICNYFRDFVAELYSEVEISGFKVEVEIPEIHIFCEIDRVQLKRVFANIVGNAMNYTKTGTTLFFGFNVENGVVILTLANDGMAISPELAENIFDPFVTGDLSRKGKGSGLGLSISKKIIEAHGGEIHLVVNSESKWNTMFQIRIPECKNR